MPSGEFSIFNLQFSIFHLQIVVRCLPFIYCLRRHRPPAFYPPPRRLPPQHSLKPWLPGSRSGGQPSHGGGIHELAAPSRNSTTVARRLVVSYATFSPLPHAPGLFGLRRWRSFSSSLTSRRRLLPFSEVGCPVLPGLSSRHGAAAGRLCAGPRQATASGRPEQCFRLQR